MISYRLRHVFPDSVEFGDELAIDSLGVDEIMEPGILDRPRNNDLVLFMLFYDEVILGSATNPTHHPKYTLTLYTPGDGHYYGNPDKPWNHSWINCRGKHLLNLLKKYKLDRQTHYPLNSLLPINNYLFEIYRQCSDYTEPNKTILLNVFENLICDMARHVRGEVATLANERIADVKRYIDNHWQENIDLDSLAEKAHYTTPHLCQLFKQTYKYSPIDYVIRLKMRQAAYLLRNPNLTITQIAQHLGYKDLFYFSKYFKKFHGKSPRALRKDFLNI